MTSTRPQPRTLFALTVVLTAIAVAAIAAVLSARSEYEDELGRAYRVEAGAARLLAAGLAEEAALRARGRRAPSLRSQAAADFGAEARSVAGLARGDRESERLVAKRVVAQRRARAAARSGRGLVGEAELTIAALEARGTTRELTDRQQARRAAARDDVRDDTRAYLLVAVGAATLSLAIALLAGARAERP